MYYIIQSNFAFITCSTSIVMGCNALLLLLQKRRDLLDFYLLLLKMLKNIVRLLESLVKNILLVTTTVLLELFQQMLKLIVKHILKLGYACLEMIKQIDTQLYYK